MYLDKGYFNSVSINFIGILDNWMYILFSHLWNKLNRKVKLHKCEQKNGEEGVSMHTGGNNLSAVIMESKTLKKKKLLK